MRTLYLRNVPDDVVDRLERLAAREGMSLTALAVRELSEVSRRADHAALLDRSPAVGLAPAEVVHLVESGRQER